MKRNAVIIVLVAISLVIGGFFWFKHADEKPANDGSKISASETSKPTLSSVPVTSKKVTAQPQENHSPSGYKVPNIPKEQRTQKPGGPYESSDPRWKWWNEMHDNDKFFEWKMPIEFYGKVVDQDNNPVEGTIADIIGTDTSASGNFRRQLISDQNGLISLTGLEGRGFGILIHKDGYYPYNSNRRSFSYATFFEDDYYEPDSSNPVIFRLRKKGVAEPLVVKEGKYPISLNAPSTINLGSSQLTVELIQNEVSGHGNWSAKLSVSGGGITPAFEEFPFTAPDGGYQQSLIVSNQSEKPQIWSDPYQGGRFYVKTQSTYGLIEFKMVAGKPSFRLTSYINPSGSKNLEYDPSLGIK